MPGVIRRHWLVRFSYGGKRIALRVSCLDHFPFFFQVHTNVLPADTLWREIDQLNQSLAQTLLHIAKLHVQDPLNYGTAVKYISSLQPVQVSTFGALSSPLVALTQYLLCVVGCQPLATAGGNTYRRSFL